MHLNELKYHAADLVRMLSEQTLDVWQSQREWTVFSMCFKAFVCSTCCYTHCYFARQ